MAPTPPDTAKRGKVHYTGPFNSHTMLFHFAAATSDATVASTIATIVSLMSELQWNATTWDVLEIAAAGSSLFFPYGAWTPIVASTSNTIDASSKPSVFYNWGARSVTTGKRAKWYLFETAGTGRNDMRWNGGESALFDDVTTAFESASPPLTAIDGTNINFYSYVNVGENDYLTHKARS